MNRRLCLDGPLNGLYATSYEAWVNGYALGKWPTGELVWMVTSYAAARFAKESSDGS